ncbi:hypothetical protein [Vreelandella profundi]|uniref:hypothetical protein n=1 Tax=Vreelandella profundi TaxID=2852117 RepID=UPI001F4810C4|nr:hypothetical protein [Halomonas profundi]
MLDHYRNVRYHDSGRGELVGGVRLFDCYGLVRAVRADHYGLPPMPMLADVSPSDTRRVHRASKEAVRGLNRCDAHAGAMALCWQGQIATHCGVVVPLNGRAGVLECTSDENVIWQPMRRFISRFQRVEFYT